MEEKVPKTTPVEIEEDAEYQKQLSLFVRCSTEKGIELVKIGEIIRGSPNGDIFLMLALVEEISLFLYRSLLKRQPLSSLMKNKRCICRKGAPIS